MSGVPASRTVYLEAASEAVFGTVHEPVARAWTTAILMVPPWGWEEVASYRSRRVWAEQLAAAGHPVLRIDLPGSGDSGGDPGDPNRVGAWVAAIAGSTAWLRASGAQRVAVIGLGLGGLLAARALDAGAPIDELVLWGAPSRGRSFLREARAFSRLQTSYEVDQGSSALPAGSMEVNGFVLSAETIAGLEALELRASEMGGLERALLLERDGIGPDARLAEQLTGAGVDVSVQPGPGWEAMTAHPADVHPPLEVMATVARWLGSVPGGDAFGAPLASAPCEALVADGVRESPLVVDGPSGRLLAILAEPVTGQRQAFTAIFLNAGAVRRIGPNRIWVETARRWAAQGVTSLRIDVEGLGDSDGDAARYADVGQLYAPALGRQVADFLDAAEARGYPNRFLLVGLCAGGYWGFQTAARDTRVEAALLLNPGALVWDPALIPTRDARKLGNLGRARGWRKLARGRVGPRRIVTVARAAVRSALGAGDGPRTRRKVADAIEALLGQIHGIGSRIVIAFSANEPLRAELEAAGIIARRGAWPNVQFVDLPGSDHTVRPAAAQRAVHDLLDRELDRLLARYEAG